MSISMSGLVQLSHNAASTWKQSSGSVPSASTVELVVVGRVGDSGIVSSNWQWHTRVLVTAVNGSY